MISSFKLMRKIEDYLMELYTRDSINLDQYRELCEMVSLLSRISYAEGVVSEIGR